MEATGYLQGQKRGKNKMKHEEAIHPSASAFAQTEKKPFSGIHSIATGADIKNANTYTRASENLLRQTIGKRRVPHQASLFDSMLIENQDLREEVVKSNIEDIGAQLSVSARYALHAIQTKYSLTDYKGNIEGGVLRMTIPEFLDAYGVTKKNYGRDKLEYNPKERRDALDALQELNKPILWYFTKINQEQTKKAKGKKRFDVIKGIDPIIRLKKGYQGLTEEEVSAITSGHELDKKLTHLEITPSSIFSGGSFVLFPEPIFRLIKYRYKKISKHFLTFVTILYIEAKHRHFLIKRYYETLTDNLHLEYLEETRQKKRLESALEENFARSKELELLKGYKIGTDIRGKYVELELNPASFYQDKKLKDQNKPLLE